MSAPTLRSAWPASTAEDLDDIHAIVDRARAGDAEAFGVIYDRYFPRVYKFVYWRVGAVHQLAEDITSDVFFKALRRIGHFTWQDRDIGAWLFTIARNLLADHYKSARHRLEVLTDVTNHDALTARPAVGREAEPEATALSQVSNVELLRALQQLTPSQQECLVLRFLQGMSVVEVAAVMGRKENAVKALTYRAVRAVADVLDRNGFER